MPTTISHPAIALLKPWFPRVPRSAVILGILASMLPDIDVVAFAFDIPYGSTFGHRGFTHSIVFALVVALLCTLFIRPRTLAVFTFLFICAISHTVFDAMTDGGLGVAFFSPFSNERYFLPWRPIRVAPIGARAFSARGMESFVTEVVWVWIPCAVVGLAGLALRKYVFHRERKAGKER